MEAIKINCLTGKDVQKKRQGLSNLDVGKEDSSTLPVPQFMKNKDAQTFNDEEVAAAESHQAEIQRQVFF